MEPIFTLLPPEIKLRIIENLSFYDLVRVSSVSREMNALAKDHLLWKQIAKKVRLPEAGRRADELQRVKLAYETALLFASTAPKRLRLVPPVFQEYRPFVFQVIKSQPSNFPYVKPVFLKDLEIVRVGVQDPSFSLPNACKRLKASDEVIIEALKKNPSWVSSVNQKKFSEKPFALRLLKVRGTFFFHLPLKLMQDKSVICQALNDPLFSLYDAPKHVRKLKCIVLPLVKKRGNELKWASKTLKSDFHVVKAAVKNNGNAIAFADDSLKTHPDIVILALRNSKTSWVFVQVSK